MVGGGLSWRCPFAGGVVVIFGMVVWCPYGFLKFEIGVVLGYLIESGVSSTKSRRLFGRSG